MGFNAELHLEEVVETTITELGEEVIGGFSISGAPDLVLETINKNEEGDWITEYNEQTEETYVVLRSDSDKAEGVETNL